MIKGAGLLKTLLILDLSYSDSKIYFNDHIFIELGLNEHFQRIL